MADTEYFPTPPTVQTRAQWWHPWIDRPELRPIEATETIAPSMPTARFEWHYGQIYEPDGTAAPETSIDLIGQYVRIVHHNPAAVPPAKSFAWHGVFTVDADELGGIDTELRGDPHAGRQELHAHGLEWILDRTPIDGSYLVHPIDGSIQKIDTVLPFNLRSTSGLSVRGNRSAAKVTDPTTGRQAYLFAQPDGNPQIWTGADILEYMLLWFTPSALLLEAGGQWANLAVWESIFNPGRNLRQTLNRLIDRRRGHSWRVAVDAFDVVTIEVLTAFTKAITVGGKTITPTPDLTTVAIDEPQQITVTKSLAHTYTHVVARGAPVILAATLTYNAVASDPYGKGKIDKAWTAAQEASYQAADALGRTADDLEPVYRRFRLAAGEELPPPPSIDAAGQLTYPPDPALGLTTNHLGKTLLRQLPYQLAGSNEFSPPFVCAPFDNPDPELTQDVWCRLDSLAEAFGAGSPSMSLKMLNTEVGYQIGARPAYLTGLNHYTPAADDLLAPIVDWEDVEATVAWAADTYAQVTVAIPAHAAVDCPRTLVIEVPDCQLWYVLPNTTTDIVAGARVVDAGTITRDDTDKLRAIAAMAVSWYQRGRRAVTLSLPYLQDAVLVGTTLTRVVGPTGTWTVNTQITTIKWDYLRADTTIGTDYEELDFGSIFSTGGGRGAAIMPRPLLTGGASGPAGIGHRANQLVRRPGPSPAGPLLRWGKVIADWSTDSDPPAAPNEVPVNPCDSEGNNVDAGTTVTLYIHTPRKADPTAAIPEAVPLAAGDVVAYHPIDVADGSQGDKFGLLIDTETMRGVWDSPQALGPSTITGSNTTAETDSWDRTSQGANDGASVKLTTRVVYNDAAGTPILYGFWRTFVFDTTGRLATISAETRYTIDGPAACP